MIRKIVLFSFSFFFIYLYGMAQDNPCHLIISGKVLDSESKEGLPGAAIVIKKLKTGVSSNVEGKFQMENLCPGTYEIEISFLGYQPVSRTLDVFHNTDVEISLDIEAMGLDELLVIGHKEEILNAQSVISLTRIDLEKSSGENLATTLGSIAGVNMLQTGSTISKPVIHGMHSNRVLLLMNGIRHEGQQWGLEHAPEIDPMLASEMSVIKGAAAVQYGADAIGGVVLINPPKLPVSTGTTGNVQMVGQSNGRSGTISGSLQGGFDKLPGLGWRIQGTLKKAGNMKAPDYYLTNTGVEEADFSSALGYESAKWGTELFFSSFNTKLGILAASHVGNISDLEDALEGGEPFDAATAEFSYSIDRPFQKVNHIFLSSKSFYKIRKDMQIHFAYGFQNNQRGEYDRVRQSIVDSGEPQLDFSLDTHNLDIHLDHRLFKVFTGSAGFSGQLQTNVFKGRQLIPNYRSYNAGLYLIEHLIRKRYEVEVGFRYDYKFIETFRNESGTVVRDEFEFNNFSAVIGGIVQLSTTSNIRLNLSSAWRPPNVNELFSNGVHQGVASFEVGDPTLDSEKALNTSLSLNHEKDWLNGSLTVYYHYIRDFIYLEPQYPETVLTIRGAFPLFEYKQVDARFMGFDFDTNLKLNKDLNWRIKAAVVRVRDLSNDDDLVYIPSDRIENEFIYTFNTSSGLQSPYVSIETVSVMEQKNFPENTDFADPPDAYNLIHIGAGTGINMNENLLNIHLKVENLLNTSYREYMNRFRYFADEPGINFSVRLSYNF